MSDNDPTYLGVVSGVAGPTITVRLAELLASGLAIHKGHTYRVGQVGSFIRIPQGYQQLYGVVSEVGADEAPGAVELGARWLRVELAGEAVGGRFERGLSQHPNINDAVHLVTESDLRDIYGLDGEGQFIVGTLASSDNIAVKLSLDKLVTRHSAILGSTGSGKSTTVASLIRSMVGPSENGFNLPGARVLLLDIHGEYSKALADMARVFSATPQQGEEPLYVPFWALEARELLALVAGGELSDAHETAFTDKLQEMKSARLALGGIAGLAATSITADSPVPFSLKKLWYDLTDFEIKTLGGANRDQPMQLTPGSIDDVSPPTYQPHGMGAAGPFLNQAAKGIRRPLSLMRSRLLDRRFDFALHPGPWEPNADGLAPADLDLLLSGWLGHEMPLTILDLSGVPSSVLVRMVGSILRVIYEALYWSREKTEGGILRPLLIVMEEAHRYLSVESGGSAADIVRRIAKEGRKYGVGAMLVSQRPSEIDETVLSQCGTLIAMRLTNPADRARVRGALPDNLAGLTDLLPVLRTGEALITGEAAQLPVRCRVAAPPLKHQPRSADPEVTKAWQIKRVAEGYDRVVAAWRAQRTTAVAEPLEIQRTPVPEGEQ